LEFGNVDFCGREENLTTWRKTLEARDRTNKQLRLLTYMYLGQ
jgi:hypothetical protein